MSALPFLEKKMVITKIRINEELELPIRCDLDALCNIQERYGTVREFEQRLIGIKKIEKDGKEQLVRDEPDIETVKFALITFIHEGFEIEKSFGNEYPKYTDKQIIASIEIDYNLLAFELHEEMRRCFKIKK